MPSTTRLDLQHYGIALSETTTDRSCPDSTTSPAEFVCEGHRDAGTTRADRVAQSDGSTVDIDPAVKVLLQTGIAADLVAAAPPKDREVEAAKAKARSEKRFAA